MDIRVELRPMVTKVHSKLGIFDKPLGQNMVMAATGKSDPFVHVAYICDAPGSPFNGLHEFRVLPDEIKQLIVDKTLEQLGRPNDKPPVMEPPPPITYNPEDFE